jgi:hypothetical protein
MRYGKTLMCIATMLALAACDDDGITGPREFGPSASIRFVNVITDTGTVDFRFVDRVENLPTLLGVPYAGYSGMFQRTHAGSRPTRIFPNATDPTLTQVRLVDTNVNLAQNTRYTFVYAGRAGGGQDELAIFEEAAPPTPPAGSIAVRVLHAGFGVGNVDVYVVPVDSVRAPLGDWETPSIHQFANVGYLSPTQYINVAARPSGAAAYRFVVTAPGSDTPLFVATPNQPGVNPPAGASYGPQPGTQISGSVLTLVLTPGTVAGTRQSTTGNQSPSGFLMIDKTLDP